MLNLFYFQNGNISACFNFNEMFIEHFRIDFSTFTFILLQLLWQYYFMLHSYLKKLTKITTLNIWWLLIFFHSYGTYNYYTSTVSFRLMKKSQKQWIIFNLLVYGLVQIKISLFCFYRSCLCWSRPIQHLLHVLRFQGLNCHYFPQTLLVVVAVAVCLLHLLVSTKLACYLCPVPIALDSCSTHRRRPFSGWKTLPKRTILKSWTDWWTNHRLNNFHRLKFVLDSRIWPWFLRRWCHCVPSLFPEMGINRLSYTTENQGKRNRKYFKSKLIHTINAFSLFAFNCSRAGSFPSISFSILR